MKNLILLSLLIGSVVHAAEGKTCVTDTTGSTVEGFEYRICGQLTQDQSTGILVVKDPEFVDYDVAYPERSTTDLFRDKKALANRICNLFGKNKAVSFASEKRQTGPVISKYDPQEGYQEFIKQGDSIFSRRGSPVHYDVITSVNCD